MSFNRSQFKSYTFRYGEPSDHQLAAEQVADFFRGAYYGNGMSKYNVVENWKQDFSIPFINKHKLEYTFHKYDIAVFYNHIDYIPKVVIEIGQVCDVRVKFRDKWLLCKKSRHSKKAQIIKDQIAKDWIDTTYPNAKFYRPEKSDCFDYKYLYDTFKEYLD